MAGTQFNAGAWLTRRHVDNGDGDRIAVRAPNTLTYASLTEQAEIAAAAFRALGLRRDDRIVFVTNLPRSEGNCFHRG